jgi:hypothetical protein
MRHSIHLNIENFASSSEEAIRSKVWGWSKMIPLSPAFLLSGQMDYKFVNNVAKKGLETVCA